MSRHADVMQQWIYDLILSGMEGQMKPGDLYTLWAVHEKVNKHEYIPKTWSPDLNRLLAEEALKFVRSQHFEKRGIFTVLLDELKPLAKSNPQFTLYIVSDGKDPIKGTPFDDEIRLAFNRVAPRWGRSSSPLLLTLQTYNGKWVAWSLSTPGKALVHPDLTPLLAEDNSAAPKPPQPTQAAIAQPPPDTTPPSSTKTTPVPAAAPKADLTPSTSPSVSSPDPNPPVQTKPAEPIISQTQAQPPEPRESIVQQAEPIVAATPAPTIQPRPEAPPSTAQIEPQSIPSPPPETPPTPASDEPKAASVPAQPSTESAPAAVPSPAQPPPSKVEPAVGTTRALAPQPAPTVESAARSAAPELPAPGPAAVVTPPAIRVRQGAFLASGLVLVAASSGLLFLQWRNRRISRTHSLISQSLDGKK